MTDTLTADMFDYAAAIQARDVAVASIGDATSSWWMRAAREAIVTCAKRGGLFNTDDVWKLLGQSEGLDNRSMGAAMTSARNEGLIVTTDHYRNSEQVSCHGRPKRLWRGA